MKNLFKILSISLVLGLASCSSSETKTEVTTDSTAVKCDSTNCDTTATECDSVVTDTVK